MTGILAWVVYLSTAKIARLEFSRSVRDAWVGIDELALADQATLKLADKLLKAKPGSESIEFARKRWFILAYLNPINTMWQGASEGIFGSRKDEFLVTVRQQLEALLADEDAYWVSQNHGHDESFQELCTEIRLEIQARKQGEDGEPTAQRDHVAGSQSGTAALRFANGIPVPARTQGRDTRPARDRLRAEPR